MAETVQSAVRIERIEAADGAVADLQQVIPCGADARAWVVWLPALGVAARHYLPLARALAQHGIAVALHEWRGIGSSDRRAGRGSDWGYRELLTMDVVASVAAARAASSGAALCIGGHSLGGQLAALHAALHAHDCAGLLLAGSGVPYWRRFPWYRMIGPVVASAPWIARLRGHFPGRRLGFGGNEARGVIADWARSGRSGRYAPAGLDEDFERRLAELRLPVLALRMQHDWLAPERSIAWLLGKMPRALVETGLITSADLGGAPADHFAWMKAPDAVANRIAAFVGTRCVPKLVSDNGFLQKNLS